MQILWSFNLWVCSIKVRITFTNPTEYKIHFEFANTQTIRWNVIMLSAQESYKPLLWRCYCCCSTLICFRHSCKGSSCCTQYCLCECRCQWSIQCSFCVKFFSEPTLIIQTHVSCLHVKFQTNKIDLLEQRQRQPTRKHIWMWYWDWSTNELRKRSLQDVIFPASHSIIWLILIWILTFTHSYF